MSTPDLQSSPLQSHPTLIPSTRSISRTTIQKKWKPLPLASQEKVRAMLLDLKTKRAGAGGNGRIPSVGSKRRRNEGLGDGRAKTSTKQTRDTIAEEEYQQTVSDVVEKLLSRLPRMPFPPTSSRRTKSISTSTSSTAPTDFDLSTTHARISSLQTQLTSTTHATRLLTRQIRREKAALKRDRAELKMLEEGMKGAREVKRRKDRGGHWILKNVDHYGEVGREKEEVDGVNAVLGVTSSNLSSRPGLGRSVTSHCHRHCEGEEALIAIDENTDPELKPLLIQLRSHLLSMQNNTAPMLPVLQAIESTGLALDQFTARKGMEIG